LVICKKAFVGRGPAAMLDEIWLPTLNTNTPQEGFELAVKLSRLAVMVAQSCDDDSQRTGPVQPDDASQLIGAAQVIALNFQTIAAANDWWRHHSPYGNTE
jgi:Hexameric tyrosine-coordinated heme protein (HTHP)